MKTVNNTDSRKKAKQKKIWVAVAAIITIVIAVIIGAKTVIESPRDLGRDLVFLNKVNTSCEWWEVPIYIGFCSGPKYTYYFGTDMTENKLSQYFKNARYLHDPSRGGGASADYTYDTLFYESNSSKKEFYVDYYNETQAVINTVKLKNTDKKYIISMSEESYKLAKEAL